MVKVREDLTGMQFGRLTVLNQAEDHIAPNGYGIAMWRCVCGCDNHTELNVSGSALKRGNTKSCGCLKKEKTIQRNKLCKKSNIYDLTGEYGIGWTSNTNNEFYFDLEDYDLIKNYCWSEDVVSDGYHRLRAYDVETQKIIRMSALLGYSYYDHIDRNPLNNRKCNFRPATASENARNRTKQNNNTSGFIGVKWSKSVQMWQAQIDVSRQRIHLGVFIDKLDAVKARLNAEKKYFGEFAPQRHLFEQFGIILEGGDNNVT